jgi:hypothetical protein
LDTVKAHPEYLALVIFGYLHVLDADNLFVSKHSLVLCRELLSRFPGFLFVPILLFALADNNQLKVKNIESDNLTCLYLRRPIIEGISKENEVSKIRGRTVNLLGKLPLTSDAKTDEERDPPSHP